MNKFHEPVLLKEVLHYLNIQPGGFYLDATVGGGGHAAAVCQAGGQVLGIDFDPEAIKAARKYLASACPNIAWQLAQGNFSTLNKQAQKHGFKSFAGILFDLGVSSHQLLTGKRGFSFQKEGPLDMRMAPDLKVTAADLVNGLNQKELILLFAKLGGERNAWKIARAIVAYRQKKKIETTVELAAIISQVKKKQKKRRLHPATQSFQALRVAVNDELNNLRKALPQALTLLSKKGRLVIISFHSGEDQIVKHFFQANAPKKLEILTKKPILPSIKEIKKNPRSRSAKLRAVEKK